MDWWEWIGGNGDIVSYSWDLLVQCERESAGQNKLIVTESG